jgi:ABC-type nitrate/sulfonate/bicarbonate transport system substrate-binding protein
MKYLTAIVFSVCLTVETSPAARAAEPGGKPEKSDAVVTDAQPSGAFTPIRLAYEAGLFKKHGLNATLQLLNPQVSAQAVISEEADFYTDGPDLINARLHGGQVKNFGGTMQQLVFQIWGAKEIKSIQDLKGKSVAASTPRAALDTATREALRGQFDYIDEKQFPKVKSADPKEFYDNSFVDALTKSGVMKNLGMK